MPGAAVGGASAPAGLFGKLPDHRDFVRRSLPESFVGPWDEWLSAALAESRARLGAGWLAAFLEAPVWRFALAPGLCGPRGVAGVLAPSVDAVGRHFPITLAALTDAPPDPCTSAWHDALEAIAIDAVTEGWTAERLAAALTPAGAPPAGMAIMGSVWQTLGAPRVQPRRLELAALPAPAFFAEMLADAAGEAAAP
ncbi:type VI secretion system-associated protein TagF [Elioraea sp. Yellowstone]|uniref:type VI secretion system-associated protein TagF n=1 Tax=Elioraea sp. Yellowstone TaxID=2592070 RepID=UPI0011506F09|nr:type VI secretion system-associated protein TagF [Elioraea sp. Yellowstone]TQF77132.1 type VI secretion system-associated protein TagF [Elioraea sp. Yellowstone]